MLASDLVEVVRQVAATDPATCDAGELTSLAAGAHRLRCWLDSVDAAVVARSAELASAGGRRSSREADVIAERAAVCDGDARGACRVGGGDAVGGSRRRDRPSGQPSRRSTSGSSWRRWRRAGRASGDDVGGRVRPQGPRPGPPDLPRRGPAAPREAEVAADGEAVDGPRRHVPHPDQPRPRSRRPVVGGVRRRRRGGEGQARQRPHLRPAQGRRVHDDGDRRRRSRAPATTPSS